MCFIVIYATISYRSIFEPQKTFEATMTYSLNSGVLYTNAIPRTAEEVENLRIILDATDKIGGVPDYAAPPHLRVEGDWCIVS